MASAAAVVESGIFGDLGEWEGKFGKETVVQGVGGRVREVFRDGGGGRSGARSGEVGGGGGHL